MHHLGEWVVSPRLGPDIRVKRRSDLAPGEAFQEATASAARGISDALVRSPDVAAQIYADMHGLSAALRPHRLGEREYAQVVRAFRRGEYVVFAPGKAHPPTPPGGRRYTDNPNEVPTRTTTPSAGDVVAMLRSSWSDLVEEGARTLAAQFMSETGGGRNCFNWNLGNEKEPDPNKPHMYLRDTWEPLDANEANRAVAQAHGLAYIASEDDIRKHGWTYKTGQKVAVFEPPHPASRFRAYASLADGAHNWLSRYRRLTAQYPQFLVAANAGDIPAVAHILKQARYYTAPESSYAHNMQAWRARIEQQLGSARPR